MLQSCPSILLAGRCPGGRYLRHPRSCDRCWHGFQLWGDYGSMVRWTFLYRWEFVGSTLRSRWGLEQDIHIVFVD